MKRVLVTGGLGFQGLRLCQKLSEVGYGVAALSTASGRCLERSNAIDYVVWGSVTDRDLVHKTIQGQDLVYHLAAYIHVDESIKHPEAYTRVNVQGTENVARACVENQVPLVHVSSCEVYGGNLDGLLTENSPLKPQSPYAASKAGADCLVQSYVHTYGLRAVIARPANVFGPGQRSGAQGAVIPKFIDLALEGKPLTVYGSGEQSRDYLHVDDVTQAYVALGTALLLKMRVLGIYNVGSGTSHSIAEIARGVIERLGSNSRIEHGEARPGEVQRFCLDSERLKGLIPLGWDPDFGSRFDEYLQSFLVCS